MALLILCVFACQLGLQAEKGLSAAEWMRGIGIAAALVGVIALILTEFIYRAQLQRGTYHWLLLFGLLFLPVVALMSTATALFEDTKAVESCASCHVMHPFVNDMKNPASSTLVARHYRNKWIPDQQCYTCHTTYGVHGTLAAKGDGFRHWLLYVTGTWKEPIQYKGSYPNANCLFCHAGTPKFDAVESHAAMATDLASHETSCIDCHGPPHPLPGERSLPADKR